MKTIFVGLILTLFAANVAWADLVLDRLLVDKKISELQNIADRERAAAQLFAAKIEHRERIYQIHKNIFEKHGYNKYSMLLNEQQYRLVQIESRLAAAKAAVALAKVEFEEAAFLAKQGQANSQEVAAKLQQLAEKECSQIGIGFERADVLHASDKLEFDQLTAINNRSAGAIPQDDIIEAEAARDGNLALKTGFQASWRNCRERLETLNL